MYILTEFIQGKTLRLFSAQHGGVLPEEVAAAQVLYPTMQALHYLHGIGIVHRDIKVRCAAVHCATLIHTYSCG